MEHSLELFRSRETRRRVFDTCYEKVRSRGAFKTLQRFLIVIVVWRLNCGTVAKSWCTTAWLRSELACNLIARNLRRIPRSSLAERPRELPSRHFTFNDKLNSRVLSIDRSINLPGYTIFISIHFDPCRRYLEELPRIFGELGEYNTLWNLSWWNNFDNELN